MGASNMVDNFMRARSCDSSVAKRQHSLLLLALVLCGRAHLLAESHVGDLKASNSRYTNPEDDEKEQADGKGHEDA